MLNNICDDVESAIKRVRGGSGNANDLALLRGAVCRLAALIEGPPSASQPRRRIVPATSSPNAAAEGDRARMQDVLRLAAEADVDVRSARKALEQGASSVRGRPAERLEIAARKLGIQLGCP